MKQLLIVNSSAALNGGASTPKDLSPMAAGSIGFFSLKNYTWLADKTTDKFGIALGGRNGQMPFVIPEVDVDTLKVSETPNAAGSQFTATITIPTPVAGNYYTLVLVKLGTGINGERNKWSESIFVPANGSMTAAELAQKFRDGFAAKADAGSIDIVVSGTGTVVTLTGKNYEAWKLTAGDNLFGTAVTNTPASPAIGDKAFVEKLARECAAGKGFNELDLESQHIYPGYPETVEDTTYVVFNLRFAVGRESGKQVDERVFQTVHIAVPTGSPALTTIRKILAQPVLVNEA